MSSTVLEFEKPIAALEEQLASLKEKGNSQELDFSEEIKNMEAKIKTMRTEVFENLTSWQRVQIARHPLRPFMLDYVEHMCDDFLEVHGDRHIGDDASMPGGFVTLGDYRCVVIGHQKGRDTKESIKRNFGSAHPEGYRKALRLMKLAEKFNLPVISLIDTPGAFPGIGAEERNIAEAIAYNLGEMSQLKVPIVAVVLGEGGSGGALGIGVADKVLMFENAYYSVISPEGCAAILWKHRQHAPEAAEAMKITGKDLQKFELIDKSIAEPLGGAHQDPKSAAESLKQAIIAELDELSALDIDTLLNNRYEKYRKFGATIS